MKPAPQNPNFMMTDAMRLRAHSLELVTRVAAVLPGFAKTHDTPDKLLAQAVELEKWIKDAPKKST